MTGGEAVKLAKIETMLEGHIEQTRLDRAERMEVAKETALALNKRIDALETRIVPIEEFKSRLAGVVFFLSVFAGAAGAAVTKAVAAIL